MVQVLDRPPGPSSNPIRKEEMSVEERLLHRPVLLHETVLQLIVRPGGTSIDCTVGDGGHASSILEAATPGGRLLGIDLDPVAVERAGERLQRFQTDATIARGNYSDLRELVEELGFTSPDGVLLDLGLSSFQLEGGGRGFSFRGEEPLDMRFDPDGSLTAEHVVNRYPLDELAEVIARYGEEPRARSIARAITRRRPLTTTRELADLVSGVHGGRRGRIHPATRTFQALRIAVNSELDNLEAGIKAAISVLSPGGRLAVISYHSLEDRIVKGELSREAKGCICPPRIPVCICGHTPSIKIVARKVIKPSGQEITENPRSRSARMRVAERLAE